MRQCCSVKALTLTDDKLLPSDNEVNSRAMPTVESLHSKSRRLLGSALSFTASLQDQLERPLSTLRHGWQC